MPEDLEGSSAANASYTSVSDMSILVMAASIVGVIFHGGKTVTTGSKHRKEIFIEKSYFFVVLSSGCSSIMHCRG